MAGYADAHGLTFFESIEHMDQIEGMTGRTTKPLGAFRDLMHELADFAKEHDSKPSEVVPKYWIKAVISGGIATFRGSAGASRVDNLSQLQSVAAEFEQNTPDATLAGFLETTALVADSDQLPGEGEDSGKVTMMTLPYGPKVWNIRMCFLRVWNRVRSRTSVPWRTPASCPRSVVWHTWASPVRSVGCM